MYFSNTLPFDAAELVGLLDGPNPDRLRKR
jgi:hypothetical protein